MCRVACIIQPKEHKVSPLEVKNLLLSMEYMGHDATGIAFISHNNNTVHFTKCAGSASEVIESNFEELIAPYVANSSVIMLHTRQATHGLPDNPDNNHPILGNKYILIHNGVVSLDEKFPAKGETDSEQLLRSIEKYGFKKGIEKSQGWASIVMVDAVRKNLVYYYKTFASSLVRGQDTLRDITYLASTEDILKKSILSIVDVASVPSCELYRISTTKYDTKKICNLDLKYKYTMSVGVGNSWYGYDTNVKMPKKVEAAASCDYRSLNEYDYSYDYNYYENYNKTYAEKDKQIDVMDDNKDEEDIVNFRQKLLALEEKETQTNMYDDTYAPWETV